MRVAPNIVFGYASLINTYAEQCGRIENQSGPDDPSHFMSFNRTWARVDHVTPVEFFNDPAYESGIFYEKSKKYGLKNTIIYMIARITLPDLFAAKVL